MKFPKSFEWPTVNGTMNLVSPLKPSLVGHTTTELLKFVDEEKNGKFRARQLSNWIYRRAEFDLSKMNDLPAAFRQRLQEQVVVQPLHIARHVTSTDGVDKLLVHRGDDQVFECVLLPYKDRTSCCLSSQVGCPMGCTFCATGIGGFDRNLDASEIVAQYLLLQELRKRNAPKAPEHLQRISRIVFMGMGEPLLNLDEVKKALTIFHDEVGLSYRHITISTVGIVPQIRSLAKEKLPIHLALSLHSPFDDVRNRLMPVNKRWPVREVVDSMIDYHHATGRKITIEYLLIHEVTDTLDQARELARLLKGVPSFVNVIPFNYVATESGFARPKRQQVIAFKRELESMGIAVTERAERGHDIAAACGQLAGVHTGKFAKREGSIAVSPA